MRIGAVRSLDLSDVRLEDRCLDLVHRPDTGTTLKNGQGGERPVAISEELTDLLNDYINKTRTAIIDDHGRKPLVPRNLVPLQTQTAKYNQ